MSEENPLGLPFTFNGLLRQVKQNGWSLVISCAAFLVAGYALISFVPNVYGDLGVIKSTLPEIIKSQTEIQADHQVMRESFGAKLDEGNRITCAACWNSAQDAEEIRRCSCNPTK